jgi:D-sedoheptulose 7-phosphate isomerase
MNKKTNILSDLFKRYPNLVICENSLIEAYEVISRSYENNGKLLICGNGGSSADSDHIVGELMKGFLKKRTLSDNIKKAISDIDIQRGVKISERLQGSLPAISLSQHSSLITAISNDIGSDIIFAQQVMGYGKPDDVICGISTSGNAENIINAFIVAKAIGMKTIAMTGQSGGLLKDYSDIIIQVPEKSTPDVQELHLPLYHALCAMLEDRFFTN